MSDERDLTPEQEARVARLLADARADEPIPVEVAARLDRVLAGMSEEQIVGPDLAPVVDIAARRRRRATTLLVAAAAVVVAGVGIGQVVGPQGSDEGAGGSNSLEADDSGGDGLAEGPANLSPQERESLGEPAKISGDSFAADVRRLQDRPGILSNASDGVPMEMEQPDVDFACSPAAYGPGKLVAVRYHGLPAVLAYRPAAGDTQAVELLQCGSAEVIRSTTIPLP